MLQRSDEHPSGVVSWSLVTVVVSTTTALFTSGIGARLLVPSRDDRCFPSPPDGCRNTSGVASFEVQSTAIVKNPAVRGTLKVSPGRGSRSQAGWSLSPSTASPQHRGCPLIIPGLTGAVPGDHLGLVLITRHERNENVAVEPPQVAKSVGRRSRGAKCE